MSRFHVALFVDASSYTTIEIDLVRRVRSITQRKAVKSLRDAFSVLCQIDTGRWAIVYDGADDPNLEMSPLIPNSDRATIIITSRNQNLRQLSPLACVEIDAMSVEDAINLLLNTAFPSSEYHSSVDREHARTIVAELGCLALAVGQAGCHIQMQKGLDRYADSLVNSRSTILRRPMGAQRNSSHRSVYAALDVTLSVLTHRVIDILSTLSFLHPGGIPLESIVRASRRRFWTQPAELLPRLHGFQESVQGLWDLLDFQDSAQALCDGFIPTSDQAEILLFLDELQCYSLVTVVSEEGSQVLRFHNLVFAWARDRLSGEEKAEHQALAVRLLTSCMTEEDEDLFDLLLPHVQLLAPIWNAIHVNDRVGFANVIRYGGRATDLMTICNGVYEEVLQVFGVDHLRTSNAALYLADAHWRNGDEASAAYLEKSVAEFRIRVLGPTHRETMNAVARQVVGCYNQGKFKRAEKLQREVLDYWKKHPEEDGKHRALAMEDLADTLLALSCFSEAAQLIKSALRTLEDFLGASHWRSQKLQEQLQDIVSERESDTEPIVPKKDPDGETSSEEKCEAVLGCSFYDFLTIETPPSRTWATFLECQIAMLRGNPRHLDDVESLAFSCYTLRGHGNEALLAVLLSRLALDMRLKLDGYSKGKTLAALDAFTRVLRWQDRFGEIASVWSSYLKWEYAKQRRNESPKIPTISPGSPNGDGDDGGRNNVTYMDTALRLAPHDETLSGLILYLLQASKVAVEEIPHGSLLFFDLTPHGPSRTCALFIDNARQCSKSINRLDRFKHHVQTHLGIRPYLCTDKATPELAWYVVAPDA
jgi:hypothetical protein